MHPQVAIAFFVTSHGFGHAARSAAVMNAIFNRWPFARFEIFTLVPEWFFRNSLHAPFALHTLKTDVGLVQTSALQFDLDKTITALDAFLPFDPALLDALAAETRSLGCQMAVCDISPLGIAVAERAGLTSILVENFTWDWIYEGFARQDRRFQKYIDEFAGIYAKACHCIQVEPVCNPGRGTVCVPPVCRLPKTEAHLVRKHLGIADNQKMVLVTMGGVFEALPFVEELSCFDPDVYFVAPGQSANLLRLGEKRRNIIFLPPDSAFFHPDLVWAADAVVGKLGYSTLAEVYHAGVPYGFISRPDFRESPVFESYVRQHMPGVKIEASAFAAGEWIHKLTPLLALPRQAKNAPNGAEAAAEYICRVLACEKEILEIVDCQGAIVGAAPRRCVHGDNRLLHRVVHVLVFDARNRLLLQKRSLAKRVAPGRWDTSVGGHVDCGEPIEAAMFREMAEELGIRPESPKFAYHYIHTNAFESEFVFTYVCQFDGQINWNRAEIEDVKFWEFAEIEGALGKEILSDNFEDEFQRYRKWVKNNPCR